MTGYLELSTPTTKLLEVSCEVNKVKRLSGRRRIDNLLGILIHYRMNCFHPVLCGKLLKLFARHCVHFGVKSMEDAEQ